MKPLKIFLHDYAGHPFQAELSRALASRGHRVTHAFFAGDPGPKGDLKVKPGDAPTLRLEPVDIGVPYTKGNFVRRRFLDLAYGKAAAAAIEREKPDIVISGNTPTEAQEAVVRASKAVGAKFIFGTLNTGVPVDIHAALSKIAITADVIEVPFGIEDHQAVRRPHRSRIAVNGSPCSRVRAGTVAAGSVAGGAASGGIRRRQCLVYRLDVLSDVDQLFEFTELRQLGNHLRRILLVRVERILVLQLRYEEL